MRTCYLLLLFCCVCLAASAQTKTIRGTVRDEAGAALAGATITGRGTRLVTATDTAGNFRLSVPEKTTALVISYTGTI